MKEKISTLKTGKYNIEFSSSGTMIYSVSDERDEKTWIATVSDPDTATQIVEGLILVEHKRFYHPEASPVFNTVGEDGELSKTENLNPPFLKVGGQKS